MSDYISKSALMQEIKDTLPQGGARGVVLAIVDDAQTVDEKEIIRKTVERIVERLEEEQSRWKYDLNVPISRTINKAIEIIKEECGIND